MLVVAVVHANPVEHKNHLLNRADSDSNSAGQVLDLDGSNNDNITWITTTFNLPSLKFNGSDQSQLEQFGAWVGISGNVAMIQAGADISCQNSATTYHFWYEWLGPTNMPAATYLTNDQFVGYEGEAITVAISMTSPNQANVAFDKAGVHFEQPNVVPTSNTPGVWDTGNSAHFKLEKQSAALLPNWGTLTFSGSTIKTANGGILNVGDAADGTHTEDIVQSGKTITKTTVEGSTMKIQYIG